MSEPLTDAEIGVCTKVISAALAGAPLVLGPDEVKTLVSLLSEGFVNELEA